MSRIQIPATIEDAPQASQELLLEVKKMLGSTPNLFRLVSKSPAALEGYLGMFSALGKGDLPASTRERVALAVAEFNKCYYCLSAHTYLGKNLAKLTDEEILLNRQGESTDPKAQAAVQFALKVAQDKGHISNDALKEVRDAGYTDAEVVEIVINVAFNIWTNYINSVADTEIDFPVANPLA